MKAPWSPLFPPGRHFLVTSPWTSPNTSDRPASSLPLHPGRRRPASTSAPFLALLPDFKAPGPERWSSHLPGPEPGLQPLPLPVPDGYPLSHTPPHSRNGETSNCSLQPGPRHPREQCVTSLRGEASPGWPRTKTVLSPSPDATQRHRKALEAHCAVLPSHHRGLRVD